MCHSEPAGFEAMGQQPELQQTNLSRFTTNTSASPWGPDIPYLTPEGLLARMLQGVHLK